MPYLEISAVAIIYLALAAAWDYKEGRIPNALSLVAGIVGFLLGLGVGTFAASVQWSFSSSYRWSHIEAAGMYAYETGGRDGLLGYLVSEIGGVRPRHIKNVRRAFYDGYYDPNIQTAYINTSAYLDGSVTKGWPIDPNKHEYLLNPSTLDISEAYSTVEHEIWHHRLARKVGFKLTALQSHKFVPAHHYLISDHQVNGQYFSSFSSSVRRGLVDARHLYEARYAVPMPGGAGYWDHRRIAERYDLCSVLTCW